MKANIPILVGSVPDGWTVSLVDNPGFGEAKEHVSRLASVSMKISSAYIYLLETGSVGGEAAAKFFKKLTSMFNSMHDHLLQYMLTDVVSCTNSILPVQDCTSILYACVDGSGLNLY